jgi:hypothetical protein
LEDISTLVVDKDDLLTKIYNKIDNKILITPSAME